MRQNSRSPAAMAWVAFAGLVFLGVTVLMVRELPSMRRELRLMRM